MLKLFPFPSSENSLSDLDMEASASIVGVGNQRKLFIEYQIRIHSDAKIDDLILWPRNSSTHNPRRKDELWKHTCFEAFIKPQGKEGYWELNLSTRGDWNMYRFDSYRKGMMSERSIASLSSKILELSPRQTYLCCELWLSNWDQAAGLDIGLTSVIEQPSKKLSYWAIMHAGSQPDFHQPQSFTHHLPIPV
jgi:hypothetical protein